MQFLPVGEGLVVAAIVLGIYRLRLRQARQQKQDEGSFMRSVQDALYNWLTIKTVVEARPDDSLCKRNVFVISKYDI